MTELEINESDPIVEFQEKKNGIFIRFIDIESWSISLNYELIGESASLH
eukprot:CAMPEP_0170502788 /NCGR_PEP_ID=MMETSP0208-20121228/42558_1 /TAXON_ID=197538 /ORGANISM="Strombidium inclinatum, Strain S3" /LENGTH=48 /DNA_ID= /DNA_START= /DNA_END= /DNA_ORIENTATION=